MIAYDLQCGNGHCFEGWFEDAETFEKQCSKGLVSCPVCDDTNVVRLPSTFAIKGVKRSALDQPPVPKSPAEAEVMARAVVDYVEKNFDNVGSDFAKEALKIHYGASEPRNIRGSSTPQEEETLRQEGVEFIKFPLKAEKDKPPSPSESDN
jgi:hypothetical protein